MKGGYDIVQTKKSLSLARSKLKKAEEKIKVYTEKLRKVGLKWLILPLVQ